MHRHRKGDLLQEAAQNYHQPPANFFLLLESERLLSDLKTQWPRGVEFPTNERVLHKAAMNSMMRLLVSLVLAGYVFNGNPAQRFFIQESDTGGWGIGSFFTNLPGYRAVNISLAESPERWCEETFRRWFDLLAPYYRPEIECEDRIGIALNSFWHGMTTLKSDQQVLSYTVVLEALLATGSNEITHQLAERVACLLATDARERLALYHRTKGHYRTRSNLVHGNLAKTGLKASGARWDPAAVHDLFTLARGVLRKALADPPYCQLVKAKDDKQLNEFFLELLFGVRGRQ